MIDFSKIRFDGELNVQNGLSFYVSIRPRIVSFLIETIGVRKRKIRVTILQELNHDRPHVHLDGHKASFAIDNGELLAGHCDNLTQLTIKDGYESIVQTCYNCGNMSKSSRVQGFKVPSSRLEPGTWNLKQNILSFKVQSSTRGFCRQRCGRKPFFFRASRSKDYFTQMELGTWNLELLNP